MSSFLVLPVKKEIFDVTHTRLVTVGAIPHVLVELISGFPCRGVAELYVDLLVNARQVGGRHNVDFRAASRDSRGASRKRV